jgi:hypothetical protein
MPGVSIVYFENIQVINFTEEILNFIFRIYTGCI